jgi:hypothetical protein
VLGGDGPRPREQGPQEVEEDLGAER